MTLGIGGGQILKLYRTDNPEPPGGTHGTGSGKYQLSVIAIGAKAGGRCSQTKPPVASEFVVRAAGPVRR